MTSVKPRLYAHRGMSAIAPENTLSAIRACKTHSIKWFECDVDVISDGTIILCHDSRLDRTTDHSGSYYGLSRADLKQIDAGSWFSDEFKGEQLPTLAQVVEVMNQLELNANIELKSCEAGKDYAEKLIDGVIAELKNLDPARQVIISSFNHLLLMKLKEKAPHISVACLWERHNFYDDWQTIMQMVDAQYVHLEDSRLTPELVDSINSAGYSLNVWTVNSLARANELFNWGVAGVFTDIAHKFPSYYKTGN